MIRDTIPIFGCLLKWKMENSTSAETTNPPPQTPISFDERKEHYEALITLFKYAIGSLTLVISVAGVFIGYTVYSDGREMRAAMREQQAALQEHLNELNSKELDMQKTLLDLIKTTREDVALTGQKAINQINTIKEESSSIARAEARRRIEQVFEENKIEDFIVEVAKEKIEPRIKKAVNDEFFASKEAKLEKVLRDLSTNDESKRELAYIFFQGSDPSEWSEQQLQRIVSTLLNIDSNNSQKHGISIYLGLAKSPIIEDYFKTELAKNPQSETGFIAFNYLIKNVNEDLPAFFLESFKKTKQDMRPNFYHRLIEGALNSRKNTLAVSILNNKELVEMLFQDLKELEKLKSNSIESCRQSILGLIQFYNFQGDYKSTYFFAEDK